MSIQGIITLGQFPVGYCWSGPQQYAQDLVNILSITFPGTFSSFNFGSSKPAPADQDKPWIRTNADGSLDGLYVFSGGIWSRPHAVPASGKERRIYVGANTALDLWSYDGGDGTDPSLATPTTGGMWMIDTNFNFKFPLGVGTNGTAYDGNPANSVTLGANALSSGQVGEERHTLVVNELAAHTHPLPPSSLSIGTPQTDQTGNSTSLIRNNVTGSTGGDLSHNNMPPFVGVYFIKRSARVYYTVP